MPLFDPLELDVHKPPVLKPSLAQWDNYQIYTLVCRDIELVTDTTTYISKVDSNVNFNSTYITSLNELSLYTYYSPNTTLWEINSNGNYVELTTPTLQNASSTIDLNDWLAIQTFSPTSIKINFLDYVNAYSDVDPSPLTIPTYGSTKLIASNVYKYVGDPAGTVTPEWLEYTGNSANLPDLYPGIYSRKLTGHTTYSDGGTTVYRGLVSFFEKITTSPPTPLLKPTYLDLLQGYHGDPRDIPNYPRVKPNYSGTLTISYYTENTLEAIQGLRSIDWVTYTIEVTKDKSIYLPIINCVLGTLWIDNSGIENQIKSNSTLLGKYPYVTLFPSGVDDIFSQWDNIYQSARNLPTYSGIILESSTYRNISKTIRILGANNDIWHNATEVSDVGFSVTHPLFAVDETRTFNYHFKPQIVDDSLGNLVMDSPKIVELWTHFCSQNPVVNDIDNELPRVNTHGYYLTKIAHLLGHRVDANGEVDLKKEAEIVPQLLNKPRWKQGDTSYSQYAYGKKGIVVPSLPTSYDRQGRLLEQYHICHDIPQLLAAMQSDIDKSLGIEQGSQIRVKGLDGKIIPFQNQLAMAIDNQQRVQIMSERIEKLYGMNLVQGQELRGLYSGIGIPVSVEKLPVLDVKGKVNTYLPFYTHQQSQSSLLGHLTAIKMNLSIALGTLMPKAENKSINPFKRFTELAGSIKPPKWLKGK